MAAKLKLTDAQIYTLRRLKSGTRYVMTGDGRCADEYMVASLFESAISPCLQQHPDRIN